MGRPFGRPNLGIKPPLVEGSLDMANWKGIGLGMALCLLAGSPALAAAPLDLVRSLYIVENLNFSPVQSAGVFSSDLDTALRKDSSNPGEVGAIDFDYRYGAQDEQIAGLNFIEQIDHDQASVVAVFKNFGKANSVNWTLCRRGDGGWRIADAWSNTGSDTWDLRDMLKLPHDRFRC